MLITGNLFINDDAETGAVISISEVNQRPVTRAIIASNLCFARSGDGIRVISAKDVVVEANMMVATGACTNGVLVRSGPSEAESVSVRHNDVTVEGFGSWVTGIHLVAAAGGLVRNLSAVGNSIRGASEGITFQGTTFEQTPVCALNQVDAGVARPLVGVARLPEKAVVAGGAASRGGSSPGSGAGRFLVGLGDPNENNVIGNAGDIYQRVDENPGPRLFVKESDETPGQGWSAK